MRESQLWVATESAGHTTVHQGPVPLASPDISDTRGAHGLHHVQEGGHYGRQPDGLGRNSRGPICEGPLECGPPVVSYKFSGAVSDVPLNETFPSVSHGPSCPGEDGQYNDGGVHQPSRGAALPSVVHAGTQTDPVELHSALAPTTVEGPAITGGTLFHPHPERMALWAWPLSGSSCQLWDSHSV